MGGRPPGLVCGGSLQALLETGPGGLHTLRPSARSSPGGFIPAPLLSWFPEAWGATLNVNVKSALKQLPNSDRVPHKRPDLLFIDLFA